MAGRNASLDKIFERQQYNHLPNGCWEREKQNVGGQPQWRVAMLFWTKYSKKRNTITHPIGVGRKRNKTSEENPNGRSQCFFGLKSPSGRNAITHQIGVGRKRN